MHADSNNQLALRVINTYNYNEFSSTIRLALNGICLRSKDSGNNAIDIMKINEYFRLNFCDGVLPLFMRNMVFICYS